MTKNSSEDQGRNRLGFPLGLKLGLVFLAAALIAGAFLFGYFGPAARSGFIERSNGLIRLSRDALDEMVRQNIGDSTNLLVKLNDYSTERRRLHRQDLPLSLYKNDAEKIRQAVAAADARMNAGFREKVGILAQEMERRHLREVERRLEDLEKEQVVLGSSFAADIRRYYLILAGSVFLGLFLISGYGLYRTVVHPLRNLRRGTQDVARGDLDVEVLFRSRDEVGGLSADFDAMVSQLRQSREEVRRKNLELESLNRNLEAEVKRKTSHLEEALEHLRRTQKQLIHAEKMASLGTLAGGVAHEFNNLIGGIRGCANEALEEEEDPGRRETLEVILRAAKRSGEITDQLLRFSRQRAMQMRPVEVTRVLEEALMLVEPDARQRQVKIHRRIISAPALPADEDGLHQVFLNLYTNAIQAMPEGGELTVETRTEERELVVRIKDSGPGIPPEHLQRIFEPFFTTKDQEADPGLRGTGLGLSVSYSIIEAHGGTLTAESESGQGSILTVRLPLTEGLTGEDQPNRGADE